MKPFMIIVSVFTCFLNCNSQSTIEFKKSDYITGLLGSSYYEIIKTNDGGSLIGVNPLHTWVNEFSTTLIKTDSLDQIEWATNIDTLYYPMSVDQDKNGDYLLGARDFAQNAYFTKLDNNGNILWTKKCSHYRAGCDAVRANNTHYFYFGHLVYQNSHSDNFVSKFDYSGNLIWSKSYASIYSEFSSDVLINSDGNFVIASMAGPPVTVSGNHIWSIDTDGNILWSKFNDYGEWMEIVDIIECANGEYAITGRNESFDLLFNRYNSLGGLILSITIDLPNNLRGQSILEHKDKFMIAALNMNFEGDNEHKTVLIDIQPSGLINEIKGFFPSEEPNLPLVLFYDNEQFKIYGCNKNDGLLWTSTLDINANFPCDQFLGSAESTENFPTDVDWNLQIEDSASFYDVAYSQQSVEINFTVDCSKKVSSAEPDLVPDDITEEEFNAIFVPNIITTNGDGINDDFPVLYSGPVSYHFVVINRWGQVKFESFDPEQTWSFELENEIKRTTDGVYFYKLTIGSHSKHGTVTLIR